MTRQRVGQCIYCGRRGPITDDHIPPKSLFAKPRPSDLVAVPSCGPCNHAASKDDEYLKTVLVLKERAGDHPEALAIRPSVMRALQKVQKGRFTTALFRRSGPVSVMTPAGLYLGKRMGFTVELARLDRVVCRMTKGLFYKHTGHVVPSGYSVAAMSEDGFKGLSSVQVARIQREVVGPTLAAAPHILGRGTMRYWVGWASDDPAVSSWIYEFFGDVRFAAAILPVSEGA